MLKKLFVFITFVVVEFMAILYLNYNNNLKKEQILHDANELIRTQYNTVNNSFQVLADTVFGGYIDRDKVIEPFNNRDREKLYKSFRFDYKYLSDIDFKQIHFHLPNNDSFLRMHKPNKYGDSLTDIRYSVKYVNSHHEPISGFEMGKILPGFRYVYPMFNDYGEHIGSVEASFSVKAFANQIEKVYNVHTHFLIHKDVLSQKIFTDFKDKYKQSMENINYMILSRGNAKKRKSEIKYLKPLYDSVLKETVDVGISKQEVFSFELEVDKNNEHIHKIVTFIPLDNIQQQYIGYFVVYHDSNTLKDLEDELLMENIAITIILCFLFLFIYRQLVSKEVLAIQVDDKTAQLQQMTVELEEINDGLEEKIKVEIEKNAQQERKLANQSKQAALGDMIGNIAHQWRQPLSAITTATTGMQVSRVVGKLSDEEFNNYADGIVKNAVYLSKTIDDFRDFISSEKKFEAFDVGESISKCLSIVNSSINNHKLKVISNIEKNIIVSNYSNELQQCIINIFNNAKDALKSNISEERNRIIFIDIFSDDEMAYIKIKDTAGGIPENIIDKIFEPYFTTKHQSQGTGLGLYMSHQIIVESMYGIIEVENVNFKYKNKDYTGAQFTIVLKKDRCKITNKGKNNDNR